MIGNPPILFTSRDHSPSQFLIVPGCSSRHTINVMLVSDLRVSFGAVCNIVLPGLVIADAARCRWEAEGYQGRGRDDLELRQLGVVRESSQTKR